MLLHKSRVVGLLVAVGSLALAQSCTGLPVDAAAQAPQVQGRSNTLGLRNGDFAERSLDGWQVKTYTNRGLGSLSPTSVADLDLEAGDGAPITKVLSCPAQSCVPAGLSEAASLRYPFFGGESAVVNEHGHRRRVNALSQRFVVGADDFAADGLLHLHFARAAVVQSPENHGATELPYFFSILTNASRNGAVITREFHYAGDDASLWHTDPNSSSVLFTDWQLADMVATGAQVAPGDELELQLFAAGCAEGAHFGELYVEGFGTKVPGLSVTSHGPSVVNPNTIVDFTFDVENHGTAAAEGVVLTLPAPDNATFVALNAPSFASCTTPAAGQSGETVCTLSTVPAGAAYTLTLSLHVPDNLDGNVTLQQPSVQSATSAPLYSAPIVASVRASAMLADLSARIVPEAPLCCDHNLGYTVTFSNQGPSESLATHVTTSFSVAPSSTSYTCTASNGASCAGSSVITGTGALNTNVDLPPNSALSCLIRASFPTSNNGLVTLNAEIDAPSDITDAYANNNLVSTFLSLANAPSCSGSQSPGGASCTSNATCNSGFCVDGVCCNSACTAQCMACDNAFAPGICTPVLNEQPHGSRQSCGGFVCRQGTCLTHCEGAGDCAAGFICQSNVCVNTQKCRVSADCSPGTYCTPLGTCESPLQQRLDDPNWLVEGAGTAAQGCMQTAGSPSLLLLMALAGSGALMGRIRRFRRGRTKLWALVLSAATAASLLGAALPARAADDLSVAASHFQLWAGDEDIWATQSATVPPHLRWGLLGFFNGAHNLVRVVSTQNRGADLSLIRYQETLDVGATLALANWIELSVAESFVWQQVNTAPFISAQLGQAAHEFSVGDLRFAPKVALVRGERVRLALSVAATFPTGRYHSFVGNATPTITPKLLLDIGHRRGLRLMLNAGVLIRGEHALAGRTVHDAIAYGAGLGVPLVDKSVRLEGLLSAVGEVGLQSVRAIDNPLEGHLGLRLWPNRTLAVDAGAGMGFTNGLGSPRWRVFVGVKTSFGGHDKPKAEPVPQIVAPPAPPPPPPAPAPEPVAAPVEEPGLEPLVAISEVLLFDLGKDSLTEDDVELLDKVDAALTAHPDARISVDGHTDISGSLAFNMKLSRQRAAQAYRWLVEHGVAAERLEQRGFGPKHPRATNTTREGRKLNRRVEFHLLEEAAVHSCAQDPKERSPKQTITP